MLPMTRSERLARLALDMPTRHRGLSLRLSPVGDRVVLLRDFRVERPGEGRGSGALAELCGLADALDVTLAVRPRSARCYEGGEGPDQYALEDWLEDRGFRHHEDGLGGSVMLRLPAPLTERIDPDTREWVDDLPSP